MGSVLLLIMLFALVQSPVMADSPPNLNVDVDWNAGTGGVADVQTAYNYGRRQEEIQLDLPVGTLGNLVMPGQVAWDALSINDKALILLNAERTAHAGMLPGVIGLPFQNWQPDIRQVAQNYADLLVAMNVMGHNYDGTPWDRIAANPALAPCREFLGYAENLAGFWTGAPANPLPVERSIYNWIYDDAGSSWLHREAVLIQDKTLTGSTFSAFNNNVGSPASEGFFGIGLAQDPGYDPYGWGWPNMGTVVV